MDISVEPILLILKNDAVDSTIELYSLNNELEIVNWT